MHLSASVALFLLFVPAYNHLRLLLLFFFSFLFFFSCESTNFHLCLFFFPPGEFTSASQRKCICEEVEGEGGGGWMDGEAEGAKAAETGKGTEQGGEGRREGGGRLITVAGLVAWRRRGPGMPGC